MCLNPDSIVHNAIAQVLTRGSDLGCDVPSWLRACQAHRAFPRLERNTDTAIPSPDNLRGPSWPEFHAP